MVVNGFHKHPAVKPTSSKHILFPSSHCFKYPTLNETKYDHFHSNEGFPWKRSPCVKLKPWKPLRHWMLAGVIQALAELLWFAKPVQQYVLKQTTTYILLQGFRVIADDCRTLNYHLKGATLWRRSPFAKQKPSKRLLLSTLAAVAAQSAQVAAVCKSHNTDTSQLRYLHIPWFPPQPANSSTG